MEPADADGVVPVDPAAEPLVEPPPPHAARTAVAATHSASWAIPDVPFFFIFFFLLK
jgi:hypothetical protein